jgi:hypothetical protein
VPGVVEHVRISVGERHLRIDAAKSDTRPVEIRLFDIRPDDGSRGAGNVAGKISKSPRNGTTEYRAWGRAAPRSVLPACFA